MRRVDHVFVPVVGLEPHLTLFSETLGLPVAWPISDKGGFRSCAVCAGNANIEFILGAGRFESFLTPSEPLTIRGIAFEPEDAESMVPMLDERALEHGDAWTYTNEAGEPMFTNVFLSGMISDAALAFICEYQGSTAADRRAVRDTFGSSGGGLLGVRGVSEITVGVSDMDQSGDLWGRFLAPVEPDRYGRFTLPEGPAIRLRHSPIDGVQGLVLEVGSLDRAREALREHDLLGPMRRSGVGLDYAHTGGLDVWLSERR